MARPAQADSAATAQRIIDVAIPLFARDGYLGAATREIAAAAGLNVANISHYFGGKRGLYEASVDTVYQRLGKRAADAMAGMVLIDLDEVMSRLYAAARAERDGVRLLVREILDNGHLSLHTTTKHFLPEIENATRMTAGLLGVPTEQARTAAVTIGYLMSRFVIQDDRSLVAAFGVRSAKEAHARVVQTLANTGRALFAAPLRAKE
jgi:AcrR family transcriptional regulator